MALRSVLSVLLVTAATADCSAASDALFIPLVVYFFVTACVGITSFLWFVYSKYSGHQSVFGKSVLDGTLPARHGDADLAGETAPERESWQISYRDLKFGPRVGIGNVGEVYQGWYRGRCVAIKRLLGSWYKDDDMVARFREEIMLLSRMNHPNVLMFIGAVLERDAGNICLVTELCERGCLHELLHSGEALSWQQRLKMARDIALGMDYLHTKAGIIQRDLKAQNLLVTKDYEVKIADFGLSRQLVPGRMRTYCGTPATMAPEVVRQEAYNEKADVFSFAIIMWELLTRQEPYCGLTGLALAYAVANDNLRPPLPAYCPLEWADLMVRCWSDDPAGRPTFDQIQRELLGYLRLFDDSLYQAGLSAEPGAKPVPSGKSSVPWVNRAGLVYVGDGKEAEGPDGAAPPSGSRRLSRRLLDALPAGLRPWSATVPSSPLSAVDTISQSPRKKMVASRRESITRSPIPEVSSLMERGSGIIAAGIGAISGTFRRVMSQSQLSKRSTASTAMDDETAIDTGVRVKPYKIIVADPSPAASSELPPPSPALTAAQNFKIATQ